MKQTQNIEETAKSQTGKGTGDVPNPMCQIQLIRQARHKLPNIFLIQNKGKGPPGRQRSPGAVICRNPEHPPDEQTEPRFLNDKKRDYLSFLKQLNPEDLPAQVRIRRKTEVCVEIQPSFKNYELIQIPNFYHNLIFTIMKKQILIIVFFVLAILVGAKSYAQDASNLPATACAPVTPLPCATDDALHPIPGKIYTYTVTVNPGVTTGNVQWFVYNATTNGTIITGGTIAAALAAAEADGGTSQFLLDAENAKYKSATNTSGSIDVSWQSFDGTANRILLVAYVEGEGGCSDNIEVFRIEPIFAFTLDIAGLLPTGALPAVGNNAAECVTDVQSAVYDGTNLTMDYGDNYVFFSVTAANFVHSWQPTFTLTNNTQSTITDATDITWAYPDQAILAAGTWNAVTDPVLAKAASGAVGAAGECIVVRVHIDHNNTGENDANAARNIILGVNGIMYNVAATNYTTASLQDLDPSAAAPCTNTATDQAQYDLTPRPEVTTTAPLVFETKN